MKVGNDVVDLEDPRTRDRWRDERFVARVLSPAEAAAVRSSPDPGIALWLAWAGKEVAYKIDSKLQPEPPPFRHNQYDVDLGPLPALAGRSSATVETRVRSPGLTVPMHATVSAASVHAVGWHSGADDPPGGTPPAVTRQIRSLSLDWGEDPSRWSDVLGHRFTERERRTIHRAESALARLWAREGAAELLGVDDADLEIVCPRGIPGRSPPLLLLLGEPAPLDVSLSHHGDLVAWALVPR